MRCSPFTAVYDACVLYPAPVRDLLVRLAKSGLFRARWSDRIQEEWKRNLLANRPDLTRARLDRTSQRMDEAVPNSVVTGYESLIDGLTLPDPGDRHVLAAAIHCSASVIVTFDLKDFPAEAVAPFGIEAQHPDEFIENLMDLSVGVVVAGVQLQRSAMSQPRMTPDCLLKNFEKNGLTRTAKALLPYRTLL